MYGPMGFNYWGLIVFIFGVYIQLLGFNYWGLTIYWGLILFIFGV